MTEIKYTENVARYRLSIHPSIKKLRESEARVRIGETISVEWLREIGPHHPSSSHYKNISLLSSQNLTEKKGDLNRVFIEVNQL